MISLYSCMSAPPPLGLLDGRARARPIPVQSGLKIGRVGIHELRELRLLPEEVLVRVGGDVHEQFILVKVVLLLGLRLGALRAAAALSIDLDSARGMMTCDLRRSGFRVRVSVACLV